MSIRKKTKKYYFSVEGETEQWYLKWLQDLINTTEASIYKVSLDCPVQKNPFKRAKSIVISGKTDIYHFSDYESDDPKHIQEFMDTIDNMKKANTSGRQINYKFGYSNLTFDLWIILHKSNANGHIAHRKNYIIQLNKAFEEHFENMDQYKHENNFKRVLNKLDLNNVIQAIDRSKSIMELNKQNNYTIHQYKGYKYYKENPSIMVWEAIEKILKDCKLY